MTNIDRVLLVSMPFSPVGHPGLGISLLKGLLARRGIACDIRYFNLDLARYLEGSPTERLDRYHSLSWIGSGDVWAEWIFARAAFGEAIAPRWLAARGRSLAEGSRVARWQIDLADRAEEIVESFHEQVDWDRYQLVGFSTTFYQNVPSLALARRIKRDRPDLPIVFGGANCDGPMGLEIIRQFDVVDYVLRGESDAAFPAFVEALSEGGDPLAVVGVCGRRDGQVVETPQAPPITDLDSLPIPEFDDYFAQVEASPFREALDPKVVLETSRGCWWGAKNHCTFCGLNPGGMAFRSKSAGRALDEIRTLARRYRPTYFGTSDNILDLSYLQDVLPILRAEGLGIEMFYETKANLTRAQVELLVEAGVGQIQPGIESLSGPILRQMRKGCTPVQNVQLLKWAHELGINVTWNILYGFPDEDPAEYERMADLVPSLYHLEPPALAQLIVQRFAPYHDTPERFGIVDVRPWDGYREVYPVDDDALGNLVYHFSHAYADGREPSSYVGRLADEVDRWHRAFETGRKTLAFLRGGRLTWISDRRPFLDPSDLLLEGVQSDIYRFCDDGRTTKAIWDHVRRGPVEDDVLSSLLPFLGGGIDEAAVAREAGPAERLPFLLGGPPTPDDLTEFLDELVARRLMMHDGQRYLALAVNRVSRASGTPEKTHKLHHYGV